MRLRRPRRNAGDSNDQFDLALVTNRHTVHLPLEEERLGARVLQLPRPIAWDSESWHNVNVDLRRLFSDMGAKKLDDLKVKQSSLRRTHMPDNHPLQIARVVIYTDFAADDVVRLRGYDATGIKGISWAYIGRDGKELARGQVNRVQVAPAKLPYDPAPGGWLRLHLRDGAGNLSRPLWVPHAKPE